MLQRDDTTILSSLVTASCITGPVTLPGATNTHQFDAFPDAPVPRDMSDARAMLETSRGLLADALRQVDVRIMERDNTISGLKAKHGRLVEMMLFMASDDMFILGALAVKHATVIIREWTFAGKHVPARWTAAHPPDDHTAAALAEALGDEGFTAYSETFRTAWAERMEQIADEREVKHGSGKVKV